MLELFKTIAKKKKERIEAISRGKNTSIYMSNIFKSRIEKTFFPDKNEKTTIKIYVFISIPLKLRYPNNKFLSFYIYIISINLC